MKTIYNVYSDKIDKQSIDLALISDIHYKNKYDTKRLDFLLRKYLMYKPNYILILGDLINDSGISENDWRILLAYIKLFARITKVYCVLGNHDTMTRNGNGWELNVNERFISALSEIEGLVLLNNETVILEEGISFTGINFLSDFYEKDKENVEKYIHDVNTNFDTKLPNDVYNVILQHSPNNLFDQNVVSQIPFYENADLAISGHQHNGCVPVYLNKIPTNRGIVGFVGPNMKFFLNNCRGIKFINKSLTGCVLSPVVTFSDGSCQTVNPFFPVQEQYIRIRKK